MEQYRIYHYKKVPMRNDTECFMVDFIFQFLESPIDATIEELKNYLQEKIDSLYKVDKKNGLVRMSDIQVRSQRVGGEHIQLRGFGLYGHKRRTPTLSIIETVEKDANNNFLPYK